MISPVQEMSSRLVSLIRQAASDPLALLTAVWSTQPDGFFCVSLRRLPPNDSFADVWLTKREGAGQGEGSGLEVVWDTVPEFARVGNSVKLCSEEWDTYWCISAFSRPERKKQYVLPGRWLFADLDYVDPHDVPHAPTFAWETSPSKWQAVWYMQELMEPRAFEHANKTMCRQSGADPGTWNANRLLRVPGSHHLKAARDGAGRRGGRDGSNGSTSSAS